MVDYTARIKELEDELRDTPYNKRTQHSIGLLKAKIARVREKAITRAGKGGASYSYSMKKSGDASVVLVGYPSVGKSTLLNALTDANSEIGDYEFTTLDVIPGVLEHRHAKIQILDVPGILKGASIGRGRGREVLSVVRNADMVIFLMDVNQPEHYPVLLKEVYDSGLRVNSQRPDVKIIKKARGGISIGTTVKLTKITKKTVEGILKEYRLSNADVVIRTDISAEEMIDAIEANKHYVPSLAILTKIDIAGKKDIYKARKAVHPDLSISAEKMINIQRLKNLIYKKLNFIRVYCKEVGKKADMDVPLIMRNGQTVRDMCIKLHKDFVKNFKSARIWGRSAKFPGQRKGLKHTILDGDIIEIRV